MKVMQVTKWQLKSRKLRTSCVYPHRYRKLIKPSRRIICFWFITLWQTYKDTNTLEEHWQMSYFEKCQGGREQDIRNVFNMLYFYDFRSESVCKVKTVWAGDHVVWSRISSILLLFIFLHGWKMVYFRNLLCTLPLRIGCHFSRLTVRYLSEGGAYQNFFFANYKAVRDIFLFLCLFKNDHKSTEKWNF